MSFQIQKTNRASAPTTLELLVFRVAGQWLAVRSTRQLRLVSFAADQVQASDRATDRQAGQVGFLNRPNYSFPVYDLAFLLGLKDNPELPESGQIVQTLLDGQPAGFTIEQAKEIQRVPVNALRQLPEIVKRLRLTQAIWAVWPRSGGELIPLIDLALVPGTEIPLPSQS